MCLVLLFLIFFVWIGLLSHCSSSTNQLNGQHLRVIWPRWSGNPKGLSGPLKAGVVLEYLSARLNFTYEMIRVTEEMEPAVGRGQINYVIDEQCDLLVHNIIPTIQRNDIVDLTLPWLYDTSAILIPTADETANIYSVAKPFQWPIWLGLGISIVCVIFVLNLIQKYHDHHINKETDTMQSKDDRSRKIHMGNHYLYVFGNLLSQGGPCISKRLPFRLVAGVWCVAAFIFVQAYTSVLFTYVVAPVNQPLVNSIYDIFENSDIHLLVRTGTMDRFLIGNNNTGVFLKIEKTLASNVNSRCALAINCIQRITPGSRNVYLESKTYLKDAIKTEFKRTGKCNLQFARDGFINLILSWALPKHSPYTQSTNQGILEFQQTGINDYLDLWFYPTPPQCDGKPKSRDKSAGNKLSRLSLKNLTGVFIVLLVGLSLSLLAFLCEISVSNMCSRRHRVSKHFDEVHPLSNDIVVEEFNEEASPIIERKLPPNKNDIEESCSNVTEVKETVVTLPIMEE